MQVFRVDDMTCGHCVATITRALAAADRDARITIDLSRHLVMVDPAEADVQRLGAAIAEAGYTPIPVPATAAVPDKPGQGTSCCGCSG